MAIFKKLSASLLWLVIFSLPFQLGLHFWPSWSHVAGLKIDYLSPILYLTDIFIFFYILSSPKFFMSLLQRLTKVSLTKKLLFVVLFLFIILNIFLSLSPFLTLYSWGRLFFYFLLFLRLRDERVLLAQIKSPLILSSLLVLGLQLSQFVLQASINGPFYYLGERSFNFSTSHIAKLVFSSPFFSLKLLRPYSTFSHPNSLAGYLLLVYLFAQRLKVSQLFKILIVFGILLTFSKAAIVTLLLLLTLPLIHSTFVRSLLQKTIFLSSLLVSFLPLIAGFLNLPFNPSSSLLSRLYLGLPSLQIIQDNFFFGVGLNNFIPALSLYLSPSHVFANTLQPVHSIPLLLIAELGVTGLLLFFFLAIKGFILFSQKLAGKTSSTLAKKTFVVSLVLVLSLTSAIDHYWITLPQNRLILALALASLF